MATDPDSTTSPTTSGRSTLRGAAALVGATLLVGGLLLLVDAEEERPDTKGQASAALGDAAMVLSRTYTESEALAERLREVHQQLARALALIEQSERLDPADRQEIESLRQRLQGLDETDGLLTTDPEAMKRTYHELTTRLNALQQRLEQPRS